MSGQLYASNPSGSLLGNALASFGAYENKAINLSYGAITAGYYAFKFTSISNAGDVGYQGAFSVRVPAPAALGLVGLGLVGLGLFSRRRAV